MIAQHNLQRFPPFLDGLSKSMVATMAESSVSTMICHDMF